MALGVIGLPHQGSEIAKLNDSSYDYDIKTVDKKKINVK